MTVMRKLLPALALALLLSAGVTPARAQTSTTFNSAAQLLPPSESIEDIQSYRPRLYASDEYLIWWLREGRIPALLTTSSFGSKGELGQADTRVIYGDQRLETRHDDRFVGGRFMLGWYLGEERSWAIEGGAVFLERDSTYFKVVSDGSTLLARPYINAQDGSSVSEIIAGPTAAGLRNGGFNGYSRIEFFSQEANLVRNLLDGPLGRLDLLAGTRFLQMRDRLDLTAVGRLLPDQTTLYGLTDHFRVHNAFYGGQLGLRGESTWGRWTLGGRGIVALGGTDQLVRTFGDRIFQTPLVRDVQNFGLTVAPSNTGRFERTSFDAFYEVGVNFGYRLGEHVRLFGGYTLYVWNSPLRAGDQVDLVVNPNLITGQPGGSARPTIPFRDDLFWAQGMNFGLELTW